MDYIILNCTYFLLYRFTNTVMVESYLMNKEASQNLNQNYELGNLSKEPRDWILSPKRLKGFRIPSTSLNYPIHCPFTRSLTRAHKPLTIL